ncbi:1,4-alpha-glucan branching protein GlgB [Carnobacterium viridans]|uniref:1,4-alpha-glucan branching enzyme GlgB n=2 Tax=Carnobacterium viridans TaxID=174587 RepID=A0A1H0YS81_9LACT|nr:1,4-alpha-glucan branching protein GlgB [Carnobacterium viridans]UDE94990.1 1,4-alpha-glucan branching protein GlgB [Carnobacterium viridans]SDQ17706.1 1,4-alpha-glucan branching enzyme [Carnobacterium viridans]
MANKSMDEETKNNLEKELYLFNTGEHFDSYLTMGCKKDSYKGKDGFRFTVWAPNAKSVGLTGEFSDWHMGIEMERIGETGCWTVFNEQAIEGQCYKYRIEQSDGTVKLKIDPYAFEFEVRPNDASIVKNLPEKKWRDGLWTASKKRFSIYERPLNIYEVHLSSWKHHEDDSWYTIPELQQELIPYVKKMGYTHIEFMPLMEHPLDASWGYQLTGYYAVSSKFGTMEEFQNFVEAAHLANIGVLMDWVPGHFNRNDYGMVYFDGTPQFEYKDKDKAENNRWGTMNFDLGKDQVQSFLISNALYWIEQFHLDGLRVDAVSSMLYLDYDIGEWKPNEDGSNHNKVGVKFIQKLNEKVFERHPDTLMIAEESTAWSKVTKPVYMGGLGFNYKWNMGWMNDTLKFFEMNPSSRKHHFNLITFSFMYAFNENFILPFSHDEVVHGKKSLMHKMPGDRYNQFASLRTLEAYMMVHPGKKLNFMGNDYGQFLEWRIHEGLEWESLADEMNAKHLHFMESLNMLYKKEHALWEIDHQTQGIQILDADNATETILSFIRKGKKTRDFVIVICNFVPNERKGYKIGVPFEGTYEECLNTEMHEYGGVWTKLQGPFKTIKETTHQQDYTIELIVPAMSVLILRPKRIFGVPKN